MKPRNLAARVGRWSAQHRTAAILGWVVFVVLATVLGGKVGQNTLDEAASGNGESKRGNMIVAAGFPEHAGEQVLVQGPARERTAAVRELQSRLQRIEGIDDIAPPVAARDGRSVVVSFTIPGSDEHAEQVVDRPLAAVAAVQR